MSSEQDSCLTLVNNALESYLDFNADYAEELIDSMKYSLLGSGKRIRPILLMEFCCICGGDINKSLPFACAVEMIHAYSLIHDDLPCMDNDDMRRGRPSNHIKYGEDMALLAGDALQSLAFEVMLNENTISDVGAKNAAKAAMTLAKACGAKGMVAGQVIDLKSEGQNVESDIIKLMYEKKTGALISAACEMGCIISGANDEKISAARNYANAIGLAFQIVDDILDVTSDTDVIGKNAGSDEVNQKSTYVSVLGLEKSQILVNELTEYAIKSLSVFDCDKENLVNLAIMLSKRKN